MLHTVRKVPAIVGSMSLIGTGRDRPVSWGNYFYLEQPDKEDRNERYRCLRVLNFWAENLKDAVEKFLPDGLVQIYDYGNHCLIMDERIPDEWYYHGICCTGGYVPRKEVLEEIKTLIKDPKNTIEEFLDPDKYYADRGWSWDKRTGIVRTPIKTIIPTKTITINESV